MHIAIDGKINGPHLQTEESHKSQREYYNLFLGENAYYNQHKGWLCGTETSAIITGYKKPELDETVTEVPEGDFIAVDDAAMYYFTLDGLGRLGWEKNTFKYFETEAHVVELITEKTSAPFKDMLRRKNISYIIAGEERVDLAVALEKIKAYFDMPELMVNGGGGINWSFMTEGLVDEVSLVITPIADGDANSQPLFAYNEKYNKPTPVAFNLEASQVLDDGSVWLRYQVKK